MLESGDFGFTFLNGKPRFDKPILVYWLQALSMSMFGLSEVGARMPSLVAGIASAWIAARFALIWSTRPEIRANCVYISLQLFWPASDAPCGNCRCIALLVVNRMFDVASLNQYDFAKTRT